MLHFVIYDLYKSRHHVEAITKFADLFMSLTVYFGVFHLTRFCLKWDTTINEIESIERLLPSTIDQKMVKYVKYLSLLILALGAVDHFLFHYYSWSVIRVCYFLYPRVMDLDFYLNLRFNWIFKYVPYNKFLAYVIAIIKIQIEFLWSFVDILIIIMCKYLISHFKYFNQLVTQKQNDILTQRSRSWRTLQVHYTRISCLVKIIDDSINPLVFLSFLANLLFIFKQVFFITNNLMKSSPVLNYIKCVKINRFTIETISYLLISCIVTTIRTVLIAHFASQLHAVSREPLEALHTFPSKAFDGSMKRVMSQVYHSRICLTGYRLFSITRGMILAMVATLVTYELVLFQF
ncbi:gustatory receptor 5a for trehalose-like [Anticarsia gemmatalis]|uniref:gustatory receptor 5a for trehalose-like n=1 Tax=Anticarsia gemmatalis TaxID=129554 RepID=UPI003F760248